MSTSVNSAPTVTPPIVVRLFSQRGAPDAPAIARYMPGNSLDQGDVLFTTEPRDDVDVVVVVNYCKYDTDFVARDGFVWTWHNEPIVRRPFAKGYDRVHTHITDSGDSRVVNAPPILNWWVGKTYDELADLDPPHKTHMVSAIASTKVDIPGHRVRNAFIEQLEKSDIDVDVFGYGRARQLDDKWLGLAPYRYSVTVENTSTSHYWTEKLADCFATYTVPLYYGATDISDYFPTESYIWLPLDNPDRAEAILDELVSANDWESRLPALREARRRLLTQYSLYGQLVNRVRENREAILQAPRVTTRVHGRRTRPGGWIRGRGLRGNISARLERRRQRLAPRDD